MAREFFKNLPNTTTPLTATRINGLLDGDEAMGNIVVDNVKGKNLFNENVIIRDYELIGSGSSAGSLNPQSGWYVSDYIEVKPNAKYYLTKGSSGSSVCFYNSSRTYVTTLTSLPSGVITVPDNNNIKYLRFNGVLTQLSSVQLEKGETATTYASFQGLGYVSGSNSNGNYIKYDDGTLIQWGTLNKELFLQTTDVYNTVQGIKFHRSAGYTLYIPAVFVDMNYTILAQPLQGFTSDASRLETPRTQKVTDGSFDIQLIGVEPFTSSGYGYINLLGVDWIAIGRWK